MICFGGKSNRVSSLGYSIIEVLIAMSVGTIAVVFLSKMIQNFWASSRNIQKLGDIEEIKNSILLGTNCTKTFASAVVCDDGTPVTVKRKNGTTLIAASPVTRSGGYKLVATCTNFLKVKAIKISNNSEQILFPQNKLCQEEIKRFEPLVTLHDALMASGDTCEKVIPDIWGGQIHTRYYSGIVDCPNNRVPVGGGGDCQFQPYGGVTLASQVTERGWFIKCCVIKANNTTVNRVNVRCMKRSTNGRFGDE